MKTKGIIPVLLAACLLTSCISAKYLPKAENIGSNPHGSLITLDLLPDKSIRRKAGTSVKGELIAVENDNLFVLANIKESKQMVVVPIREVGGFMLSYAQPKKYGWTIPVFTLGAIIHGGLGIFTAPINWITTIAVTTSGARAFQYREKDITYEELNMFARFPQGIPPNVDLESIQ